MGGGAAPGAGVGLVAIGGGGGWGRGRWAGPAGGRALATGGGGGRWGGLLPLPWSVLLPRSRRESAWRARHSWVPARRRAGDGRPRTAAAPLGVCSPSTTRVALSGSPGTARKASNRLSRKRSSLWLSISCGRWSGARPGSTGRVDGRAVVPELDLGQRQRACSKADADGPECPLGLTEVDADALGLGVDSRVWQG